MKRAAQEFSRFANDYSQYNIIQREVAKKLLSLLPNKKYKTILDIGCGSGEVYKNLTANNIEYKEFTGVDISKEMLSLHPHDENITLIQDDFNSKERFKSLTKKSYDVVLSSSAIQWSSDLDATLKSISLLSYEFYFAIFTSKTFHTLHQTAGIESPIYSSDQLSAAIDRYYNATYQTAHYKLYFDSTYDMLKYIKLSGVSGGERQLGYRDLKRLIESYPLDYLEFEVLFISATRDANV
ncbi:Biotin synthesis protein BioC [hydrothermal vent metagenome]|uniref:Biotin synthesis protein BioC n=1 Tax=hydrothermal vent metagenome TaxID=652676 RepID=A0A1W1BGG2_9ZZZZ